MDFEALQATRESCRVYSDRPVPRETLAHLVDVARLAPSGCNAQPWRFIIIDEPEARAKLIEALDDDGLTGCPWGDRVPNFILICEDEAHVKPGVAEHYGAQHFAQMDIGMAAMALCYEATSMGLGTCWLGAGFYPDIINRNVDLQTDEAVHCVISIGKANLPAFAPKRKELVKVCGMDEAQLGQLGAWQKEAVLAARLAPSAINQQPWKIVADKTSVSILETTVLYKKYAPLDRGICMLHAAVGAAKAGRTGLWKKVDGGYAMKA